MGADAWDVPRNGVTKEHFLVALEKLTAFDLVAVLDENSREIAWSGEGLQAVLGWKHIPAVRPHQAEAGERGVEAAVRCQQVGCGAVPAGKRSAPPKEVEAPRPRPKSYVGVLPGYARD